MTNKELPFFFLCRRENFTPNSNSRVCSWHFPNGKAAGPLRFAWTEGKALSGQPGHTLKQQKQLVPATGEEDKGTDQLHDDHISAQPPGILSLVVWIGETKAKKNCLPSWQMESRKELTGSTVVASFYGAFGPKDAYFVIHDDRPSKQIATKICMLKCFFWDLLAWCFFYSCSFRSLLVVRKMKKKNLLITLSALIVGI